MKIDFTETERAQLERKAKERNRRDGITIAIILAVLSGLAAALTDWS